MATTHRATCNDCGFDRSYPSPAKAAYALRRHSCERQRERTAREQRKAVRAAVDEPKPCHHKYADHQHGTHARYVLDQCRCIPCRHANNDYEANRAKLHAYGRWNGLVDAEPARQHVRALMAQGMGLKRIARVSGVAHGSLSKLMYGVHDQGKIVRAPAKRLKPKNSQALLATKLDLAGGAKVDGIGTRRRLQALVALGYPQAWLGREIGVGNIGRTIHGGGDGLVMKATADLVTALYERLSMTLNQPTTHREMIAASRSRAYAKQHGWLPPLALDDDHIEDPDYSPVVPLESVAGDLDEQAIWRRMQGDKTVRLTKTEKAELARRWVATGRALNEMERITGVHSTRYRNQLEEAS